MKRVLNERSWPATEIDYIGIDTNWGAITVVGHDSPDVVIRLRGSGFSRATTLDQLGLDLVQEGRSVTLRPKYDNGILSLFKNTDLRFEVLLPTNKGFRARFSSNLNSITVSNCLGELEVISRASNIRLSNVRGEATLVANMGSIRIDQCTGEFKANAMLGNVRLLNSDGVFDLRSDSGSIKVHELVGKLYASASLGEIKVRNMDGEITANSKLGAIKITESKGQLSATTTMGSIKAEMMALSGPVTVEGQSGSIDLRLPLDIGLDLDIEAAGIRSVSLPEFNGTATRGQLMGKNMSGGIPVHVRASSGSVRLRGIRLSPLNTMERSWGNSLFSLPQHFFEFNAKGFLLSLGFCLLLNYGFSAVVFFLFEQIGNMKMRQIYTGIVLGYALNSVVTVMLVTWLAQRISERFRHTIVQYLAIIGLSVFGAILVQVVLGLLYWQFIGTQSTDNDITARQPLGAYLFIPAIVAVTFYYFWQRSQQITRKISEQAYQLLQMERLKTTAELDALQARINPHFLYNALNSIASLVHEDPDKAEKMTLLLSKLFRFTIGSQDQHHNTIAHEVEIAKTYLEVEQVRFGPRLEFAVHVDPGLEERTIPRFLLQPLVENAIKHGTSKMAGPGLVEVNIYKEGIYIVCSVADNGAPFDDNFFIGYGLNSIQEKLKLLYNDNAFLEIKNKPKKRVVIYLPN